MAEFIVCIVMSYFVRSLIGVSFDDQLCGGVAHVVVTEHDI